MRGNFLRRAPPTSKNRAVTGRKSWDHIQRHRRRFWACSTTIRSVLGAYVERTTFYPEQKWVEPVESVYRDFPDQSELTLGFCDGFSSLVCGFSSCNYYRLMYTLVVKLWTAFPWIAE